MSLPAPALGQAQFGELNGRVTDPDGLSLPGVTITLTEPATGFSRTAVSAGDGGYVMINLRPGTYDINVLMSGFKTVNQTGLIVNSGAQLTINFGMELATIEEVVTVTAETPLVEVTNSQTGGTLTSRETDSLPANFRNFTALTQMVPGMTPQPISVDRRGRRRHRQWCGGCVQPVHDRRGATTTTTAWAPARERRCASCWTSSRSIRSWPASTPPSTVEPPGWSSTWSPRAAPMISPGASTRIGGMIGCTPAANSSRRMNPSPKSTRFRPASGSVGRSYGTRCTSTSTTSGTRKRFADSRTFRTKASPSPKTSPLLRGPR